MNFFKKLFGSGSKEELDSRGFVEETARSLIAATGFDLDVSVTQEVGKESEVVLNVEFYGADEEFLCQKEGQVLEAIQIFLKRVLQNRWPDDRAQITVDAAGFSEANEKELHALADKLRNAVLTKKRPVYFRALPPKDRKIVHRFLAEDDRIRTRSVGEGTFKKIKIFLANGSDKELADGVSTEH
jgi:spoIIIJ-associated protein